MPRQLAVIGLGKMGTAVRELAASGGWTICAEIARLGEPAQLAGADVAIEFSTPSTAVRNIITCLEGQCPVVSGTTGWYDELPMVQAAVDARGGALFWAANFSIGAHTLMRLASAARRLLPVDRFPSAITETHHVAKRDAPSGTALQIARGLERGARIASVRTAQVPGTHEVVFDGRYEQLRLEHVVTDRRVFAEGALVAAEWLVGRRGTFTMQDLLGES